MIKLKDILEDIEWKKSISNKSQKILDEMNHTMNEMGILQLTDNDSKILNERCNVSRVDTLHGKELLNKLRQTSEELGMLLNNK
jgi:hypothetical protein